MLHQSSFQFGPLSYCYCWQVDRFIEENNINSEATLKIRTLSNFLSTLSSDSFFLCLAPWSNSGPESQRKVIARPLTGDVQNPFAAQLFDVLSFSRFGSLSSASGRRL